MINSETMSSELDSKRKVHHLGGGKEKQDQQRKKGGASMLLKGPMQFSMQELSLSQSVRPSRLQ